MSAVLNESTKMSKNGMAKNTVSQSSEGSVNHHSALEECRGPEMEVMAVCNGLATAWWRDKKRPAIQAAIVSGNQAGGLRWVSVDSSRSASSGSKHNQTASPFTAGGASAGTGAVRRCPAALKRHKVWVPK